MTTPTTTTTRRRPQWMIATRTLLVAHLHLAAWLFGTGAIVLVAGHAVVSIYDFDRYPMSWFGTHGATWFAFALSIVFVVTYLPLHVTSGMTRRSFIRSNLIVVAAIGCLYGSALGILSAIEGAVFELTVPDFMHSLPGWSGPWLLAAGQSLLTAAGLLSGLLVGMAYYRTGPWRGTLLLVLTVAPVLLVVFALDPSAPWQRLLWGPDATFNPVVGVLLSLGILAAGAAAFTLITRRVPINTVEA